MINKITITILLSCLLNLSVSGQNCSIWPIQKSFFPVTELTDSLYAAGHEGIQIIYYEIASGFKPFRVSCLLDENGYPQYWVQVNGHSLVSKEKMPLDNKLDSLQHNDYQVLCSCGGGTDFMDAVIIIDHNRQITFCSPNYTLRTFLTSKENNLLFSDQFWIQFFREEEMVRTYDYKKREKRSKGFGKKKTRQT